MNFVKVTHFVFVFFYQNTFSYKKSNCWFMYVLYLYFIKGLPQTQPGDAAFPFKIAAKNVVWWEESKWSSTGWLLLLSGSTQSPSLWPLSFSALSLSGWSWLRRCIVPYVLMLASRFDGSVYLSITYYYTVYAQRVYRHNQSPSFGSLEEATVGSCQVHASIKDCVLGGLQTYGKSYKKSIFPNFFSQLFLNLIHLDKRAWNAKQTGEPIIVVGL